MKHVDFSPKQFLQSRRPEQFSDTNYLEVTELDRSLLEYHLSTLTNRSQEADFERFAHRLCKREVCPNLLPQTGPVGGGDSKVDSETYPVADDLALAWIEGIGREAAEERWAFAFSAKGDWRSKVRSDVKKLVSTGRNYAKAFFVTSQFVRDKVRAEVEDDLQTKYQIDVRILDRSWILDRIFDGRHEAIAVEELRLTGLSHRTEVAKGVVDAKRERELRKLEDRLMDSIEHSTSGSVTVDDSLDIANLARSLEKPRSITEGYYIRAIDLSIKYGSTRQIVEAKYQWAKTLYWWFEDYTTFDEQYTLVQEATNGSRNVYDLERLFNLWNCLSTSIAMKVLDAHSANLEKRTRYLLTELKRLMQDKERPSTSLQAETLWIHVQQTKNLHAGESSDELLRQLKSVVERCQGLVGYPLETLVEILTEIGSVYEGSQAYDELFETILDVTGEREGEVRVARLLLSRGERQVERGQYVESIATLGRALRMLYKHETRSEAVYALYLCGRAYDEIGLRWAARGTLLASASIATDEFWKFEEINVNQAVVYRSIAWIELSLGRLPQTLAWYQIDTMARYVLMEKGYSVDELVDPESKFELFVGRLLLHTDFSELQHVTKLPHVLDKIGLDLASDALLYLLGHTERLEDVTRQLDVECEKFANWWSNVRLEKSIAVTPKYYNHQQVELGSRILGCKIDVQCLNQSFCVALSESLLAALEAILATGTVNKAIAHEPDLRVEVKTSESISDLLVFKLEDQLGKPKLEIKCKPLKLHELTTEQCENIRKVLREIVVAIMARIVRFQEWENAIEKLLGDERALERSILFTGTFSTLNNVLGNSPKNRLGDWFEGVEDSYEVIRQTAWQATPVESNNENSSTVDASPNIDSVQQLSPETFNPNKLNHDQIVTSSLIRESLWNKAGWSGTAYLTYPSSQYPPMLALLFTNRTVGRDIFLQWKQELGQVDIKERLRITIIKGIDIEAPHAYRVIIGSNVGAVIQDNRYRILMSRFHRMDATTPINLDRFLHALKATGLFFLTLGFAPEGFDGSQMPDIEMDHRIGMHQVYVRNAWEIGRHDIDIVGVRADDKPIIPDGVEDAPVIELLKYLEAGKR